MAVAPVPQSVTAMFYEQLSCTADYSPEQTVAVSKLKKNVCE